MIFALKDILDSYLSKKIEVRFGRLKKLLYVKTDSLPFNTEIFLKYMKYQNIHCIDVIRKLK